MKPLYDLFAPNVLHNAKLVKFVLEHVFTLTGTVGLVMEGVVAEEVKMQENGEALTLRLVGAGDFLQLDAVIGAHTFNRQFVCETQKVVIALVGLDHFRNGLHSQSTEVQAMVSQEILTRCHRAYQETVDAFVRMTDGNVDNRVLWVMQRFQELSGKDAVAIRKRRIADQLRLAPETVSRALTRLENRGLVARDKNEVKLLK